MESVETAKTAESVGSVVCICRVQPFMSVADAARLLGRSKEYFYAGLRDERFPGTQFGRSWGILRTFMEEFLAQAELGRAPSFDDYAAAWLARTSKKVAV